MYQKIMVSFLALTMLAPAYGQTFGENISADTKHFRLNLDVGSLSQTDKVKLQKTLECKGLLPPYTKKTPFFGGRSSKNGEEKLFTLSQPLSVYGSRTQYVLVSYMPAEYDSAEDSDGVSVFLDKSMTLKQFAKINHIKYNGQDDYVYKTIKMGKYAPDTLFISAQKDDAWGGLKVFCGYTAGT